MLIIRLQRTGKKNQPLFRVVLTDKRMPIKGRYIEKLGFLNPRKKEYHFNSQRIKYWISHGAYPSDTVYNILVKEQVLKGPKRKIKIKKKRKKEKPKAQKEILKEQKKEQEKEQKLVQGEQERKEKKEKRKIDKEKEGKNKSK